MQNAIVILEENLEVSYKTKHTFAILSSNYAPWYISKCIENLYLYKNIHMNVYSSFIDISKTYKKPRCPSVGEYLHKLIHSSDRILLSDINKKQKSYQVMTRYRAT